MGEVVKLSDYRAPQAVELPEEIQDSLVPIEFAVGFSDRKKCLSKIAECGIHSLHIRRVTEEPEALLYLIGVKDAIRLNKRILELESISDEEIARRIDVIQMLENVNLSMMDSLWASFTRQGNFSWQQPALVAGYCRDSTAISISSICNPNSRSSESSSSSPSYATAGTSLELILRPLLSS